MMYTTSTPGQIRAGVIAGKMCPFHIYTMVHRLHHVDLQWKKRRRFKRAGALGTAMKTEILTGIRILSSERVMEELLPRKQQKIYVDFDDNVMDVDMNNYKYYLGSGMASKCLVPPFSLGAKRCSIHSMQCKYTTNFSDSKFMSLSSDNSIIETNRGVGVRFIKK